MRYSQVVNSGAKRTVKGQLVQPTIIPLTNQFFCGCLYYKMKKPVRQLDGFYHIDGKKWPELFGSRTQVMNGTAYKTTGGLVKSDLLMNKWGRIVSADKHKTAKKERRLEKAGYFAKKGKFGYVKKTARKNRSRRH